MAAERTTERDELAAAVLARAAARGATIAVAESLTGGLVADALVRMPGASVVLRLGIVAYATPVKATELGVPTTLLDERGPVDIDVAVAMARGVRARAAIDGVPCTLAVATTGVAGPGAQDGHPPGEAHVAVEALTRRGPIVLRRSVQVPGDREAVRAAVVVTALGLLADALDRTDLETHSGSTA